MKSLIGGTGNKWLDDDICYLYISHLGNIGDEGPDINNQYWVLPTFPDSISDQMDSTFTETQALGRSAPVFTFSSAGPRKVQVELKLHRDMMEDVNNGNNHVSKRFGEDYVDCLIRALQSIAVPKYNLTNKMVEPPLVAMRLGKQLFVKGVVTSGIALTYEKPILSDGKYARVSLSLTISEVDPYDASEVFKNGSYRGEVSTLRDGALTVLGNGD